MNDNMDDARILSITSKQIPFIENNDSIRVHMACNQMRQSICLTDPDVPLIKTGYEKTYTHYSSSIFYAKEDGECVYVDEKLNILKYNDGTGDVIDKEFRSYLDFDRTLYSRLTEGYKFKKGDILATTLNINDVTGELMLGKNLVTAFLSEKGTFEDSIIISESAAKKLTYRSTFGDRIVINDEDIFSLNEHSYIPILPNGSRVSEGDILFKISTGSLDGIASLVPNYVDITAPLSGTFYYDLKIKKENISNSNLSKFLKKELEIQKERDAKLFAIFSTFKNTPLKYIYKYCKNNKRKKTKKKVDELELNDSLKDTGSIVLDQRKKVIVKTAAIDYWIVSDIPAKKGSKLSNRHGNKGVVTIYKDEDMPLTESGVRMDVIVNPLGVISRMNLGQLYEQHINWAISNIINENKYAENEEFLEVCLKIINVIDNTPEKYVYKRTVEFLETCTNKSYLVDLIKNYGLQVIQPPFYSCTYEQLKVLLQMAGVEEKTNVILKDDTVIESAVGCMYWFRLLHEPSHKIFARSTGVYGKYGQAPSSSGAHRVGEMETWAFMASEAWNVIKETISINGDNPEERKRKFLYMFDGAEEYYKPNTLDTSTMGIFKTLLKGTGLHAEY